jgi:hypothetical protein
MRHRLQACLIAYPLVLIGLLERDARTLHPALRGGGCGHGPRTGRPLHRHATVRLRLISGPTASHLGGSRARLRDLPARPADACRLHRSSWLMAGTRSRAPILHACLPALTGVLNTSNRKPPLRIPLRRAAEILTHPGQVEVVSPKRVDVLAHERSDVAQRFVINLMAFGT